MEEKQMSGQESLQLITDMIQKAKASYHENGTSSIMWGCVVAVCGLVSYAQVNWDFKIGFDIWMLTAIALIPQIIMSIRSRRNKRVATHTQTALNAIWAVYAFSIFALVFYGNVVPGVSTRLFEAEGIRIVQQTADGSIKPFNLFILSQGSLFLLLYAMPTMATGLIARFKPMTYAAILCYGFFIISCYTGFKYDMLLNGLAGIFNWLIPGLILRKRCADKKRMTNV